MSKLSNLFLNGNKYLGAATTIDHSGAKQMPDLPIALHPKVFYYCGATHYRTGDGGRQRLSGFATYDPNISGGAIRFHCQPDFYGNLAYGDDHITQSNIWTQCEAEAGNPEINSDIDEIVPHCERLGYLSNCKMNESPKTTGWFGPGGSQGATPPIDITKAILKRVGGQNICRNVCRKGEAFGPGEPAPYFSPLQQGDIQNGGASLGGQDFRMLNTVPDAGQNQWGISNPYLDSEVWGGWTPSTLGRPGDIPIGIGEEIDVHGYDLVSYSYLNDLGQLKWTDYAETNESLNGDFDLSADAGNWDWRFFATVITRLWKGNARADTLDGVRRDLRFIKFRAYMMYWDIENTHEAPIGTGDSIGAFVDSQIRSRIEEEGVLPTKAVFDCKITANVYSFKCGYGLFTGMSYNNPVALWDKMDDPKEFVYVWSHTNFTVTWRQAMPFAQ